MDAELYGLCVGRHSERRQLRLKAPRQFIDGDFFGYERDVASRYVKHHPLEVNPARGLDVHLPLAFRQLRNREWLDYGFARIRIRIVGAEKFFRKPISPNGLR